MKAYLTSTQTSVKFRGNFIFESLSGAPKEYIGEGKSWLDKEKELWTRLDSKYADKWTMNAELVKQTLCTEIPKEVGPELDRFLEKTCNQLRKIESTEMTASQLAAQNIL